MKLYGHKIEQKSKSKWIIYPIPMVAVERDENKIVLYLCWISWVWEIEFTMLKLEN